MRIAVLGAGSIGLHLAAQLQIAGIDVILVCRGKEQAQRIKEKGIDYIGLDGSNLQLFLQVQSIEELLEDIDWIFLTVKQTHLLSIIPFLKVIDPKVPILCFQNGLGHEEVLKVHLPLISIYYAITTEGAYRTSVRSVQHTGSGHTYVGSLHGDGQSQHVLQALTKTLKSSTLDFQPESNMKERIWKKLFINSCINPLTALLHIPNGRLLENSLTLNMMDALLKEAITVAEREGIIIRPSFLQDIVQVCRNTYGNRSSMLQDIEAGRETEIQFINGTIVRMAEQWGIAVPTHSLMVNLILAKQQLSST